ncbi:MAG: carboxylating nicotinate-nucleotide diphosphorylase [Methanobrevibacter sp.]|uniref:carboxylating nicotinate-nucleotide diphosphorylase n=1 Tax=Methanobrevibacter sp. TaxID=66852 RepID=UPI0026E0E1F6|nr:carboxylating nicotinate-nucleotide diphosphorylase [Methanobrevibacter sp.]MDO5848952.1 carboxylating nicotinate-nucleotide diphosphorylase [Methanobrevibacter sp.]
MDRILEYMILEDEGFGDITSNAVIDNDKVVIAQITSKEKGILAGVEFAKDILNFKNIDVIFNLEDGSEIDEGDLLFYIEGRALDILLAERSVLNLLMHMSGVATSANSYVKLVEDDDVIVAGTRKTAPAFAKFDKIALNIGGADTHRFSLDDMVLIKDNHIKAVGTPLETLKKAQENVSFSKKIEIEVESLDDAIECVRNNADIVMLDNMSPEEVKEVLNNLDDLGIRQNSLIEVSGGINEDNILDYSCLDIDVISVGGITHSSRSLNFSLNFGDK